MLLARENVYFVMMRQRLCQCLGIDLRTRIVAHGIAMNHQNDLHQVARRATFEACTAFSFLGL